ncbi:hypothetical protein GY45DRAFT_1329055 [Cubamyces sp. BRFM 1775]|nr:hypothetical protein GY45DRAFT_1329055 [Cubamyces sp. BRFM 1775]
MDTATNSTQAHEFPAPVGGAPFPIDFAPSILFVILYALLIPVIIWRVADRRSRTIALLGTACLAIERIVTFSLRANAALKEGPRESAGLQTYFQATFGVGYITMSQDLTNLFRALLVDTTFARAASGAGDTASTRSHPSIPLVAMRSDGSAAVAPGGPGSVQGDDLENCLNMKYNAWKQFLTKGSSAWQDAAREDQPRLRKRLRHIFGLGSLVYLTAIVMNVVASIEYRHTVPSGSNSSTIQVLRGASAGIAFVLIGILTCAATYAIIALPRVPKIPSLFIVIVAHFLALVGCYRLIMAHATTTSLLSTAHGSQNTRSEKVAFWVLSAAPEWVAAALLVSINGRRTFRTGLWGDLNSNKPQPKDL